MLCSNWKNIPKPINQIQKNKSRNGFKLLVKTLDLEIRRVSVPEDESLKQLSNRCEKVKNPYWVQDGKEQFLAGSYQRWFQEHRPSLGEPGASLLTSCICYSVRHSGVMLLLQDFSWSCCLQPWEPHFVEDRGDGKYPGHSTMDEKFGKYLSVRRDLVNLEWRRLGRRLGKCGSNLTQKGHRVWHLHIPCWTTSSEEKSIEIRRKLESSIFKAQG